MLKKLFGLALALLATLAVSAQVRVGEGQLSGSFESNSIYYQDDSAEGSVSMKGYVVGNIASKGMDPHRVHLESYWRAAKVPDTYHSIFEVEILDDGTGRFLGLRLCLCCCCCFHRPYLCPLFCAEKTISWDKTRCRFKLFTPYPEAMYLSMVRDALHCA